MYVANRARSAIVSYSVSCILWLIIPVISVDAGANVPLTNSEWIYFALWKLEANGLTDSTFTSSRPLEREEIAQIVAKMKEGVESGRLKPKPHERMLIEKLSAEFAPEKGFDMRGLFTGEAVYHYFDKPYHLPRKWSSPDMYSLSFWGSACFHPSYDITLYEEVDVRRGRETEGREGNTASSRMNVWRWDYTADFQRAYIRFHRGWFSALLGRQSLSWGPGYCGSLILSDNSPAFDMVLLRAKLGPVKAIAFSAMLDKMWSERGDPPYRYLANRYLSGHRIDWLANSKVELGLSELILYGGEARNMELQYINPLIPYYASQWNSKLDDNILVSFDFSARPVKKLKLYFQFLIDDFNYSDHDPNALGYIVGLYISDPFRFLQTDLRAEYTRVDTWTYTHLVPENQFTHFGWVIGHQLGPDADQLFLELSRMLSSDARLKLSYAFKREGSRTVADRYRGEDYKKMEFPSGAVTRQQTIRMQFLWEQVRGPQVDISWQVFFTRSPFETCEAPLRGEFSVRAGHMLD